MSPDRDSPHRESPDRDSQSGFEHLGDEHIWSGWRVKLQKATFRGPDGDNFTRDVVRHPGAVAVVPLTDDGNVLMVRQYRGPLDALVLEIPAGTRDVEGEPPADTAARELEEEVGVVAGRIVSLGIIHNSPGFSDQATELFLATELEFTTPQRHGPEETAMTVEEVSFEEAMDLQRSGALTDAQSVLGLLLAREHLLNLEPDLI